MFSFFLGPVKRRSFPISKIQIILSTAGMSAQKNVFAIDVARASLIPANISAGIFAVAPSDNKKLVSPPFGANFASSGEIQSLVYL